MPCRSPPRFVRRRKSCRSLETSDWAGFVMQNPPMICRATLCAVALLIGGPFFMCRAHAGLGEGAGSVMADAARLQGAVDTLTLMQYDRVEITAASGLRVREYLTRDGTVFAVAWRGPVFPDLARLLGSSFKEYAAALAASAHPGLHRSVRVASSALVVESGGHLRAYAGRAYLPARVPAGVPVADLR